MNSYTATGEDEYISMVEATDGSLMLLTYSLLDQNGGNFLTLTKITPAGEVVAATKIDIYKLVHYTARIAASTDNRIFFMGVAP